MPLCVSSQQIHCSDARWLDCRRVGACRCPRCFVVVQGEIAVPSSLFVGADGSRREVVEEKGHPVSGGLCRLTRGTVARSPARPPPLGTTTSSRHNSHNMQMKTKAVAECNAIRRADRLSRLWTAKKANGRRTS